MNGSMMKLMFHFHFSILQIFFLISVSYLVIISEKRVIASKKEEVFFILIKMLT